MLECIIIIIIIVVIVVVGSGYGYHSLKGRIWGVDPQVRSVNRYRYPVVVVVLGRSSERYLRFDRQWWLLLMIVHQIIKRRFLLLLCGIINPEETLECGTFLESEVAS
jgi:hypothetical protein